MYTIAVRDLPILDLRESSALEQVGLQTSPISLTTIGPLVRQSAMPLTSWNSVVSWLHPPAELEWS